MEFTQSLGMSYQVCFDPEFEVTFEISSPFMNLKLLKSKKKSSTGTHENFHVTLAVGPTGYGSLIADGVAQNAAVGCDMSGVKGRRSIQNGSCELITKNFFSLPC